MSDIELVIKIPTELYDLIQNKLNFNGDLQQKDIRALLLAVDDGTPLPNRSAKFRMKDIIRIIENILKREFHCDALQANLVANWILDEVEKSEQEKGSD